MRFKKFLNELVTDDKDVIKFLEWTKSIKSFPQSSDPAYYTIFLEDKLPANLVNGYRKTWMLYYNLEDNMLPTHYQDKGAFLNTINQL